MAGELKGGAGWAVVTGASSGLGAIFADQLAQRGMPLGPQAATGRALSRCSTASGKRTMSTSNWSLVTSVLPRVSTT